MGPIKLTLASSHSDRKIEYSTAEEDTAKGVALCVLQALSVPKAEGHVLSKHVTPIVISAVNETGEEGVKDTADFMKRAYKRIMRLHYTYEEGELDGEKVRFETSDDVKNWPKLREDSSVAIMLRSALKELKIVDQKTIDEWFRPYGAKRVIRRA